MGVFFFWFLSKMNYWKNPMKMHMITVSMVLHDLHCPMKS